MSVVEFKTYSWMEPTAAEQYHSTISSAGAAFQLVRRDIYLRYLQTFIKPGRKILDLGCGSGLIAIALSDLGYDIVGCDVSEAMLNRFRTEKGSRQIELRQGNAFDIPGADNEFDAVISRMFIQHFPNWPLILREKARVTKPGGIIVYDFANLEHLHTAEGIELPAAQYPYCTDPADAERYYAACTQADLRKIASKLNLDVLQIVPHGLLLNNAQFWKSVGASKVSSFYKRLDEFLENSDVRDFLAFLEEEFVARLAPQVTYGNIAVLQKIGPAK